MRIPDSWRSPRGTLILGFVVAFLSGVVLWLVFHQPALGVMATVSGVGVALEQQNWLPSRWLYAAAGLLLVGGVLLANYVGPAWFLLVAAACAAAPTVLVARALHGPPANDELQSDHDR